MAYPREIHLAKEREEELRQYLRDELLNHDTERSSWVEDVKLWNKLYWSKPDTESATGPLKGGSTLIVPLIATTVESIHARNMTTLYALDQFTSIKLPPFWDDISHDLEKVIDYELLKGADITSAVNNALLENTKYGTAVGKSGYERIVKTAVRYIGDVRQEFEVPIKHGVCVNAVPIINFLMPFRCNDPQVADWCGEEHSKTPYQIRLFEDSGFFREGTIDKLGGWINSMPNSTPSESFLQQVEQQENRQQVWPKRINWKEIWLAWDTVGDGKKREIVVHFHEDSGEFFSIRYNWHEDLHRPYRITNHFPVEHRWPGIGICKMLDQFQIEVTTQHRQKIDNGTIANMRMIKVNKLSGYGPNEPVFAGKIWLLDNPKEDIDIFQLGEIYPSGYQNEQLAVIYSQQRSGVNELTLGMPQAGTPGTAAGDLTRVQEGNRRHDFTYKFGVRRFVQQLVVDATCNIMQFGVRDANIFKYLVNGQKVQQFLSPDRISEVRSGVSIDITLAGQNQNKLVDRASWTQITGMLTQYYGNLIGLSQQLGDPKLGMMIALKALMASSEGMQQVLESFDLRNIQKLVITNQDYQMFAPQLFQMMQMMKQMPMQAQQQGLMQNGSQPIIPTGGPANNSIPPQLIQQPGLGLVNPINTTPGGNY